MTATFEGLNGIDNRHMTELRALACPPKDCTNVIKAFAPLFGYKTDKEIQSLLKLFLTHINKIKLA